MNNVTTMEGNVPKIMPYQEAQALSVRNSSYSLINLLHVIMLIISGRKRLYKYAQFIQLY